MTPKQKRFVEEYIRDSNATQAAIRAGYSKKTARQIGDQNLSKLVIADAIENLVAPIREGAGIELAGHLAMMEKIRNAAFEAGQYSAATTAEFYRGKASNLYTERSQVTVETVETLSTRRRSNNQTEHLLS